MATTINMPQVGQDIETARITEWHFKIGDEVKEGDILAIVESDKASFEVEVFESGVVLDLFFEEGDEAEVLKPIAIIGRKGEKINESPGKQIIDDKPGIPDQIQEAITENIQTFQQNGKTFASPSARRVARENNLTLSEIAGSGPNGRILKKDVISFLEKSQKAVKITPLAKKIAGEIGLDYQQILGSGHEGRVMKKDILYSAVSPKSTLIVPAPGDKVIPFDKVRKRIAERLGYSKQTIPHYYLFLDVDFSTVVDWRETTNKKLGIKISVNDIIVKVVADALVEFPELNAHVDDEKIVLKPEINIGVAVSTPNGLLVPIIPDANQLNLGQINEISKRNADNARRGVINFTKPGTFTISNLGMFGISRFLPIINPPECAILSIGAIEKKVVPSRNGIAIIDNITLGLACDHRAVDGAMASQFMKRIKEGIENFSNI
jgi:pyruvate dehydrogenase E2 component (dihydrolipoamide acetyltransferase)